MSQAAERRIKRWICWVIGHASTSRWWGQWCVHTVGYRHRPIYTCCSYCMSTLATEVERDG